MKHNNIFHTELYSDRGSVLTVYCASLQLDASILSLDAKWLLLKLIFVHSHLHNQQHKKNLIPLQ